MADFGLSRRLQESVYYTSKACGIIPYMDPKIFNFTTNNKSHKLNKKSDIYSLGVLFWELTSGSSPFNFEGKEDHTTIMLEICKGKRETPILGTNSKFVELYQSK